MAEPCDCGNEGCLKNQVAALKSATISLPDANRKLAAGNAKLREALDEVLEGYEAGPGAEFDWPEWYERAKAARGKV